MYRKSIFIIAVCVSGLLFFSWVDARQERPSLWASISVSRPLSPAGWTKDLSIHFALVNDGSKTVDPKIESSKIIVNGKELEDSGLILGNGPRDKRWNALPPGESIEFNYALESYFKEPGIYRVFWKGDGFETPIIEFRITPYKTASSAGLIMPQNIKPPPQQQQPALSGKIAAPDKLRFVNGSAEAKLVLMNTSQETVRVYTLYQEWRVTGGDKFTVLLSPDHWKSDAPPLEEVARHYVNLKPSEQVSLPFHVIETNTETLSISAEYKIDREFARKYETWSGTVKADPITVRVKR